MTHTVESLKFLELLKDLPADQSARVAGMMTERSFARREIVYSKGDSGQFLYFLLEGRLQGVDFTLDGREVGLYFVEPGHYFGEMAVIDGQPQADFVIAIARSRVALLSAEVARKLMSGLPEIAEKVLLRLSGRLRSVAAQRALLGLPNPAQRVCAQLVLLMEQQLQEQGLIPHAPTHQELAIMINASRETVTRVFQVLQARGMVVRDGGSLKVLDPKFLRAVAEGLMEPPKAG